MAGIGRRDTAPRQPQSSGLGDIPLLWPRLPAKGGLSRSAMKRLLILLFGVALSMAPTFSGWAATPIVEYLFNEAGDSPPSTGSSDICLVLVQKGAAAAELPSAAGKGVRGGTDRCLDQCLV